MVAATRDDDGAASAGSQLQIQIYVNRRTEELDGKICSAFRELAGATLSWRSPLSSQSYREYWDKAFLEAVGQGAQWPALKGFWPGGGPHWDALAVVARRGRAPGVVLAEAKSHVDELLKGSAIGADVMPKSRLQIEQALAWTQGSLGICDRAAADWCDTPLYQSANRLAHLQWLTCRGVDTWLVHILFTGDRHIKSATESDWEQAIGEANRRLGLEKPVRRAGHITLSARAQEELEAPKAG